MKKYLVTQEKLDALFGDLANVLSKSHWELLNRALGSILVEVVDLKDKTDIPLDEGHEEAPIIEK